LTKPRPVRPFTAANEDIARSALLQQQDSHSHPRVGWGVCECQFRILPHPSNFQCPVARGTLAISGRGKRRRVNDPRSLVGTGGMRSVLVGDLHTGFGFMV